MPRSAGRAASSSSRAAARSGERRSTQAMTAPIQGVRDACSNIESVSESLQAACTSTVVETPARSSWGSSSAGSNVRLIGSWTSRIHASGSRSRFQRW